MGQVQNKYRFQVTGLLARIASVSSERGANSFFGRARIGRAQKMEVSRPTFRAAKTLKMLRKLQISVLPIQKLNKPKH